MHLADPEFPPIYSGHGIDAPDDPVSAAFAAVASGDGQGGDIYWARETAIASCAIVLEPGKPIEIALQAVPIAMVALGDALGAIAPPNVAVT
jgi:BirA family biotin operon repressor/biotin-[acetyl-CoA-carboxylase] ligase